MLVRAAGSIQGSNDGKHSRRLGSIQTRENPIRRRIRKQFFKDIIE